MWTSYERNNELCIALQTSSTTRLCPIYEASILIYLLLLLLRLVSRGGGRGKSWDKSPSVLAGFHPLAEHADARGPAAAAAADVRRAEAPELVAELREEGPILVRQICPDPNVASLHFGP